MKDKAVKKLIEAEAQRQRDGLELIPSENYVSQDVMKALASEFTNKYAEGYPGKRYYGGQEFTDQLERLAIDRAKQLFGADHANVQPHSGAQANQAVLTAWCQPGDTIMAMDLTHGGHLTHGHPVTFTSQIYKFIRYQIKDVETGEIDYDQMRSLARQTKPKLIIAGYSSYPRKLNYAKMSEIGNEIGAVLMADVAHIAGLIAAGELANPFDHDFHVLSSTTHKTLRGPRGGLILSRGKVSSPLQAPTKNVANLPTLIDRAVFPGLQGGPHMNSIAAKAVAFDEASRPEFKVYAKQVLANAKALADELMRLGFKLVTNGTDNHLILIDVKTSFDIDGAEAELVCDKIGLTLNKNVIPNDALPPFRPSGVRLGTPAITTRGLKEADMKQLAGWIHAALTNRNDEKKLENIHQTVVDFARQFPLP